jgi:Holliday junction resolvase
MSESAILREVLMAVSRLPKTMVWRNQTGALRNRAGQLVTFGLVGSPDIIGVTRGRAIAIECKSASGRQSEAQKRFEQAWRAAGGIYVVARSAAEALEGIGHG